LLIKLHSKQVVCIAHMMITFKGRAVLALIAHNYRPVCFCPCLLEPLELLVPDVIKHVEFSKTFSMSSSPGDLLAPTCVLRLKFKGT
jgi:hypothetical protein